MKVPLIPSSSSLSLTPITPISASQERHITAEKGANPIDFSISNPVIALSQSHFPLDTSSPFQIDQRLFHNIH